jgi:hypothetical protein
MDIDAQDWDWRNAMSDGHEDAMLHGVITEAVIGCAFDVINELGAGFLESVYEKAMVIALRAKGLSAVTQHPLRVMFRFGNAKLEYKRLTRLRDFQPQTSA